ncbi:two-component system sensor histidine kinase [Lactococcus termiticola]|uniref:Signal transduction histidine-protein kinase ArlS n=2 Tax=Lactococcus termiticola TaxID=2169526 RepID=A0A2R5HF03_9LACT|nr:two-component system sensor histidine kinase [Lactococcus termiticola]
MLRWAFANTIFCFVTFTIFSILIYQLTLSTFISEEKRNMLSAMDNVERALSASEVPLSFTNLPNFLQNAQENEVHHEEQADDEKVLQPLTLSEMVGARKSFYVYNVDRRLIYSTSKITYSLRGTADNTIHEVGGDTPGYMAERRIISRTTGQVIGYLQAFYDMSFYYSIRTRLLVSLVILEILAIFIAQFAGYFMASHFMRPLEKLHDAMVKQAKDPTRAYKPLVIETRDEIEDLAEAYNTMVKQINSYIERQQRFTYDASHELRTPLAVLDGHISMLNRWGKDDPEILEESLQASLEETRRMKSLLEDMLTLSRLGNATDEHQHEVTDLENSIEHMVKNFRVINPELDISFDCQVQQAIAQIYENHYEQALTILIDNAIKYSPEDRCHIKVKLTEDDGYLMTSVADSGYGISEEDIEHIFDRFFRADKARNRDVGGSGLGLSIISHIVENYQGSIEVQSALGEGTTFIMKIPKIKEVLI